MEIFKTLHRGFEVRKATREEFFSVFNEPQILDRLEAFGNTKPPVYREATTYIITYKNYRLIFTLREKADGLYEIHIACPKDSIKASRVLILAGLQGLVSMPMESELKVRALITCCPEGKIANMCRKLGFKEVKRVEDKIYFILNMNYN